MMYIKQRAMKDIACFAFEEPACCIIIIRAMEDFSMYFIISEKFNI